MLRSQAVRFHRLSLLFDVVGSLFVFVILLPRTLTLETLDWRLLLLAISAVAAWPLALHRFGLYGSQRREGLTQVVSQLVLSGCVATAAISAVNFVVGQPVPLQLPMYVGANQFALLALMRLLGIVGLRFLRRSGRNYRNILVVGSGPRAAHTSEVIEEHPEWGLHVIGFLEIKGVAVDPKLAQQPIFGFDEAPRLVRDLVIDEVIVACPRGMLETIAPVVEVCAAAGVPVTLLSDLFGYSLGPPRVTHLGSLVALNFDRVQHSRPRLVVKRVMDLVGASVGLVLFSPILAVAIAVIRFDSMGPAIFRQERCGLNGRRFSMLKLRTMVVNAEASKEALQSRNEMDGPVFKIRNDPRLTRVGRLLRRWSIDELPQLWNVLKGDMSLVGPRPPVPEEVRQYETLHVRRLSMRPGISCLWQVSGRNLIGFEDWVKLDLEYIDAWSLSLDLEILLKTIPAALTARGAS